MTSLRKRSNPRGGTTGGGSGWALLVVSGHGSSNVGHVLGGDPSGFRVGRDHVVDRRRLPASCRSSGVFAHLGDAAPADARRPGTPRRRPRWPRSAPPARCRRARPASYASARHSERLACRAISKSRRAERRPVDPAERRADAVRVAERVADRQAHVGQAELGDRRPVGELDHRVDHRLRMDDHLDLVVRRRRTARAPRSPRGPCSSACSSRS